MSDALSRSFRDVDIETGVENGKLMAYLARHGEILSKQLQRRARQYPLPPARRSTWGASRKTKPPIRLLDDSVAGEPNWPDDEAIEDVA